MLKLSKLFLMLYVNGTYVSTVNLPSAGGNWNVWQEYESTLSLTEGINTISFRYDTGNTGNVNLDSLAVNLGGTADPILLDNGGFERTNYNSAWTEWHPEGQTCAYGVDSGSGTNPPESPMEGDKRAYFYSSGVYQQSIHQGISIPNGTYQVRAWVRVANTAPSIGRMGVTGYGGNNIYVDMPDSGSGWVLLRANNVSVTPDIWILAFTAPLLAEQRSISMGSKLFSSNSVLGRRTDCVLLQPAEKVQLMMGLFSILRYNGTG